MEKSYANLITRIGRRLFGDKPAPVVQVLPLVEEEIPRYPPFMKGLPAAPVERILATQTELIRAIEHALSLPDVLYRSVAAPVISRYAAFSHLLPASESHYHRGAGGLFRHGLEVAHWATLASQDCLFATHTSPKERKAQELRWRLAVCFAGLLHDIGKPVSDMAVVDKNGQHTWNPCDENLTEWAAQHQIDRYFLRWRDNRHKRHEQFSALVIERVLPRESRSFILEPGPDIMQAMLETIHGLDRGSKLYELVITADCKSVERDLKAHYQNIDSALGMPVEKYLFDAMRRLVKSGQWSINEKGARLWRFQNGLHIVWRAGAQDIVTLLAKDKVPGIPRDEDTLADILIELGFAIPKSFPDGRQYRYWKMQPEGLENPLYLLRLKSTELIFSGEPPVMMTAIDMTEQDEPEAEVESTTIPSAKTPKSSRDKTLAVNAKTKDSIVLVSAKATSSEQPNEYRDTVTVTPSVQSEISSETVPVEMFIEPEAPKPADDTVLPSATLLDSGKPKDHETPSHKTQHQEQSPLIETPVDSAKSWLQNHGLAGEWLMQIVSNIILGKWKLSVDLLETQDNYLLPFPGTAEKLNIDPNLFMKTLDEAGWLVTDVLSPMRKVQTIQQVRGVLLAKEPSAMIKQLMTVKDPSAMIGLSEQPSPESSDHSTINPKTEKNDNCGKPGPKKSKPALDTSANKAKTSDKPIRSQSNPTQPAKIETQPAPERHPAPSIATTDNIIAQLQIEAIRSLMTYVSQFHTPPEEQSPEGNWHTVSNTELERFLAQNPGIKRTRFMLDIANHPDCRSISASQGIQVRLRP